MTLCGVFLIQASSLPQRFVFSFLNPHTPSHTHSPIPIEKVPRIGIWCVLTRFQLKGPIHTSLLYSFFQILGTYVTRFWKNFFHFCSAKCSQMYFSYLSKMHIIHFHCICSQISQSQHHFGNIIVKNHIFWEQIHEKRAGIQCSISILHLYNSFPNSIFAPKTLYFSHLGTWLL